MLELAGLIFGGASRLAQHFMDLRDKDKERDHEARMFDLQAKLQEQRFTAEAGLRSMDIAAQASHDEMDALMTAMQSQAQEARDAGGWVAKLSASVRPVLAYWFAAIYTVAKFAGLYLTISSGVDLPTAIRASYTEFDGTVLASILSFYFADRSLRKAAK